MSCRTVSLSKGTVVAEQVANSSSRKNQGLEGNELKFANSNKLATEID